MSKKKLKTKNLRNILVSPFHIQWSQNDKDGITSVQNALTELLPSAKLERTNLNFQAKGNKKKKKDKTVSSLNKHENIYRTYLAPGFQSVIRGLEERELCCVVLSGDITPPMIQRVVCCYSNTFDVPLIVVPDLKSITKSTLGFPTMVLGFKKVVASPDNKFYPVFKIISQNPCIFETSFTVKDEEDKVTDKIIEPNSSSGPVNSRQFKKEDLYLYRTNRNEREFTPQCGLKHNEENKIGVSYEMNTIEDFIRFEKTQEVMVPSKIKISNKKHEGAISKCYSDCYSDDSIDEDNIFFVDNNPDQSLLETEQSKTEEILPETSADQMNKQDMALSIGAHNDKRNIKTKNKKQLESKVKNSVVIHNSRKSETKTTKPKHPGIMKGKHIFSSEKTEPLNFIPMRIKTITSNPKKVRRKKSNAQNKHGFNK